MFLQQFFTRPWRRLRDDPSKSGWRFREPLQLRQLWQQAQAHFLAIHQIVRCLSYYCRKFDVKTRYKLDFNYKFTRTFSMYIKSWDFSHIVMKGLVWRRKLFFCGSLVLVSWQAFISSLSYEAGFYKPTVLKVHPPFCRITAYATMPG